MTAASSVLSVIYKIRSAIGLPCIVGLICTTEYDALAYWQLVQITRSVPAEGTKAGCRRRHCRDGRCSSQVGRLLRKRLRYGPHNASGRTRMDVGWHSPCTSRCTCIVRRPSIIVTPSSRTMTTTTTVSAVLCHRITCVFCGFILVQTTWPHPAADIGNTLGELLHWCSWYLQLQCWFAKRMTSNLVQFYVSQNWQR